MGGICHAELWVTSESQFTTQYHSYVGIDLEGLAVAGQILNPEKLDWQEGQSHGVVSLTMHIEIDDALGHTIGIGSHAAIGSMVAGPGAHDGNDGTIGADVDVVCRVALGKGDG